MFGSILGLSRHFKAEHEDSEVEDMWTEEEESYVPTLKKNEIEIIEVDFDDSDSMPILEVQTILQEPEEDDGEDEFE